MGWVKPSKSKKKSVPQRDLSELPNLGELLNGGVNPMFDHFSSLPGQEVRLCFDGHTVHMIASDRIGVDDCPRCHFEGKLVRKT